MGDGRVKHPVCPICVELKVPTTYWCCVNCPGTPGAWKRHAPYHKAVRRLRNRFEDGGVTQQRVREVAEEQARRAAQSGDAYEELVADGLRYLSKDDWRRAARACREAIALRPDKPELASPNMTTRLPYISPSERARARRDQCRDGARGAER
jgi:hypothetical protein